MAITLDATVGGANANTYADLSTANSFIEGLVLSDDTAAWDNSSNDNKNRALFTAAQRIDREKFLGARVVYLNNNRGGLDLSGLEDFAAVSIGNINVTPRFYGATGIDRIPPIVDHYLMGIRIGGRANLQIKRS